MQSYFIFLDYLELRRRIEKRLSRPFKLFIHSAAFCAAVLMYFFYLSRRQMYVSYDSVFPDLIYGYGIAIWSVLLLIHGVQTFLGSGALSTAREKAIESEMRERVEKDDSHWTDDPKDLFRLHGLLENDIRNRSSSTIILLAYGVFNVMLWVVAWGIIGGRNEYMTLTATQYTPFISIVFLIVLMLDVWRRSRHEARTRILLSSTQQNTSYPNERLVRLSDDGELINYEFEGYEEKKKKHDEVE